MEGHILVLSSDLDMDSVGLHNFVHQGLHRTYLDIVICVFSGDLVDDKSVLWVEINGETFHFEDFGYFTACDGSVMEDSVTFSIDCFEIKLA